MSLSIENEILSEITVHMKYARYLPEQKRRETWTELVTRNMEMHIAKFPNLAEEIKQVYQDFVFTKKVLPSMRSLQFGGRAIEVNPARIYNCAYLPIDAIEGFSEALFLLLGGTGVGYSVQKHHIDELPEIYQPSKTRTRRYLIEDSIIGWADSVKVLFKAYTGKNTSLPIFDYSDIRPKGARLVTAGGKAPGPGPLRECLVKIEDILKGIPNGGKLKPIQVHDIMCHIADAVLAGGIRRAAMISLFSADDKDMISCKSGAWWEQNPQRGRANNSAVLLRHRITKDYFINLWNRIEASGAGEPGIYFTNDKDWGTNPCVEIALRPFQFCNLTELNVSNVTSQEDLNARAKAGAFIGTLQASYTDFHYLREVWKRTTEKDALVGVGMTGIADGAVLNYSLAEASQAILDENARVAEIIGINKAARTACVKPSGTTSLVLGTASGIHARHNDYYIRRLRVGKNEAIYNYLWLYHNELLEDDYFRPHDTAIISIPQKAPQDAIMRTESPLETLERVKTVTNSWVKPGHRNGQNSHNVSCTISIKQDQWRDVGNWMWDNRNVYTGISVLPYDGGSYKQAPFEDCSKETYEALMKTLTNIDLRKVIEEDDSTNLGGELACAGNNCEIK